MSSEKKTEIGKRAAGIPSKLRVLTATARSINESSSAREIEFQHATPTSRDWLWYSFTE